MAGFVDRRRTFTGIRQAARPEVQGEPMRLRKGGWYWKRGPLEVGVSESFTGSKPDWRFTGSKPDWRVTVCVFGVLVAGNWRPTAIAATTWANSKLAKIERALLAPRPVGRSER